VIFVFGVVVAPLAHSLGHRNDHVHTANGIIAELDDDDDDDDHDHELGDDDQHHAEEHEHGHADHDHGPHQAPDPHHGEGSPQHLGVVVSVPTPFILPAAGTKLEWFHPLALESADPGERRFGPIQARAPPA
jgi:hypothetical protein